MTAVPVSSTPDSLPLGNTNLLSVSVSLDFSFVHFVLTTLTPNCSLKVPDSCAGPLHWLFLLLGIPFSL